MSRFPSPAGGQFPVLQYFYSIAGKFDEGAHIRGGGDVHMEATIPHFHDEDCQHG